MADKNNEISGKRKILFSIIMLLIPVVFFILAELLLRVTGYGNDFPLVQKKVMFGKEKYVVNREVARRYFTLPESRIPEASEEVFDAVKKPNTLRIFCLGGSTTAGFPYEINATFPFQLQFRLREALFEHNVEVVNLGIAAVNSYTVLDLLPEILELEPDLFIIYLGHNEFYGAHGVGSSQYVSSNRFWVSAYLKLRRLRLVQLLQSIITAIKGGSIENVPKSMMQAMAREQAIPLESDKFRIACQNFEANLSEIIRKSRKQNVPVLVSTLISNLKDQKPFVSNFSPTLDEHGRHRCETLLAEGRNLLESGENEKALQIFSQALEIDSTFAELQYYLGQALLGRDDSTRAYTYFAKARDLDQLRFRAPGEFNRIIQRVTERENIPIVDMERVFALASSGEIPGKEFLLEHLHPNFNGYRLMSQAFLEALRSIQIIDPPRPIAWKKELLSADHIQRVIQQFPQDSAGVTELDLEFGEVRNFFLIHRWPYPEKKVDLDNYTPLGSEFTKSLAVKHFRDKTYWDKAHYELARNYLEQKQYYRAFQEFRAVYYAFPENYYPAMRMGDALIMEQRYREARQMYDRALKLKPEDPHLLAKMGNLFIFTRNFPEAVKYLKESLEADSIHSAFSDPDKANVLYLFGVSNANLKNWPEAGDALDEALRLQPGFPPAEKLKLEIQEYLSKEGN
jgi:tetratricopeptide (TPR) repeat protein